MQSDTSRTASPASPPSPFDASDRLRPFSDVRGAAIVAAHNWRLFAFGCLVVAVLSVAVALVFARAPREVPYVIATNGQNAPEVLGIGQMLTQDQRAEILITQYALRQFVQNWRMVVPAADFQQKMINDYVTPFIAVGSPAAASITTFYQAANPYDRAKRYTVEVDVDEPVPQTATTYELHWTETVRSLGGNVEQTTEWRGFATVAYVTPTATSIRLNPAGVQITNLTVEQVAATSGTPSPNP